ncbi:helix-turn-helix domain-containing protein [Sporolactobacillus sp. CPB3-1]|uniref:Helix-turn-helix domain-containing protein n=1 Tax=Sporolactobacillus mangiferae TaxID=2940498 RepID=A0ABT0M8A3_9BACL|nr:helix-turn-helix transcriptional regulator [Sporolactobacillus mangiferae]MCL1631101.1 helix-turn-helix domain-containing protein [Sporolactobacillus mangiferae]
MLTVDLKKLRSLRESQMSLKEMAARLGYQSANGYYYLESGRSKISAETLAKVASVLCVPIQELFTDQ